MRVGSQYDPWPASEIVREVAALREARRGTTESLGHIHFRLRAFTELVDGDTAVFGDELRAAVYGEPALPPASPWLGNASPAAPVLGAGPRVIEQTGSTGEAAPNDEPAVAFTATPGDTVPVRWWLVQTLGSDGRWRERLLPSTGGALPLGYGDVAGASWVAVTAISRTGVAGKATVVSASTAP
jgi:hypothetical protein